MMNILYVWFPASWGPSVVEAIQTRNVTCLAKKPIVRDPHIFDRKEAARGSRARQVTCGIQKWNIKAEGFHPILVANARVDWLAMDDDDITKKFPILLEGILQDVYSFFFWLGAAWVKSRAERPSVSGVNRQLHVQIGCKLRIGNRKDELTKQAKRNKLRIKPGGN